MFNADKNVDDSINNVPFIHGTSRGMCMCMCVYISTTENAGSVCLIVIAEATSGPHIRGFYTPKTTKAEQSRTYTFHQS